ncbi:MAG: ribonuclease HII [Gammaproteobacteria bacterium]
MKRYIAGVDEVGRGPLAGPVLAAAVILNPKRSISGLADSKQLSARQRERLFEEIKGKALAFALGRAEVQEIDRINIFQATLLAMQRAVAALPWVPAAAYIDGKHAPELPCMATAVVKGDQLIPAVSAASIIAKVARDREMSLWHERYPGYGFCTNKGYATQAHLYALATLGATPLHRRSFKPVSQCLQTKLL